MFALLMSATFRRSSLFQDLSRLIVICIVIEACAPTKSVASGPPATQSRESTSSMSPHVAAQAKTAMSRYLEDHHVREIRRESGDGGYYAIWVVPFSTGSCSVEVSDPTMPARSRIEQGTQETNIPCGEKVERYGLSTLCDCSKAIDPAPCIGMRVGPVVHKDSTGCSFHAEPPFHGACLVQGEDYPSSDSMADFGSWVLNIPYEETLRVCGQTIRCSCDYFGQLPPYRSSGR